MYACVYNALPSLIGEPPLRLVMCSVLSYTLPSQIHHPESGSPSGVRFIVPDRLHRPKSSAPSQIVFTVLNRIPLPTSCQPSQTASSQLRPTFHPSHDSSPSEIRFTIPDRIGFISSQVVCSLVLYQIHHPQFELTA
jgi:hypothetical protein